MEEVWTMSLSIKMIPRSKIISVTVKVGKAYSFIWKGIMLNLNTLSKQGFFAEIVQAEIKLISTLQHFPR